MVTKRIGLAVLLALVVAMGATAKGQKPGSVTGSFSIVTVTPMAGQIVQFETQTSPLNDCCGGDSVLAWVDTTCTLSSGVTVLHSVDAANSPIPGGGAFHNWAYVELYSADWFAAGLPQALCSSTLFWDGAHNPSLSKNNKIAGPLNFIVAPGI
jgi:hypothetical protein